MKNFLRRPRIDRKRTGLPPGASLFALLLAAALLTVANVVAKAQDNGAALSGPTLGIVFDTQVNAFKKILGMPGSSMFSAFIDTPVALDETQFSNARDFAVALASSDHQPVVVQFAADDSPSVSSIEVASPSPARFFLSPSGAAAAFYYPDTHNIRLIAGLPSSPSIVRDVDVSAYPETLANAAISDDAATFLASFAASDEETVIAFSAEFSEDAPGSFVLRAGRTAGISFRANSSDAVILDGADHLFSIHLNGNSGDSAVETALIASGADGLSAASDVAVTADGNTAVVLNSGSGNVVSVGLNGRGVQTVDCRCQPTRLQPLKGNAFLLTESSAQPAWLLDMSSGEPRTLFVPQPVAAARCQLDAACFMKGPYASPRIVPALP